MLMFSPIMFYIHLVETERPPFWFYKRRNSRSSVNKHHELLCVTVRLWCRRRYLTELWEQLLDGDVKQHVRHLLANEWSVKNVNEGKKQLSRVRAFEDSVQQFVPVCWAVAAEWRWKASWRPHTLLPHRYISRLHLTNTTHQLGMFIQSWLAD